MGGKIDAFIDCSSPYSYIAFAYLRQQRELLKQYNVEIEFHPVFLGGINHATGNQSPAFNKYKAALSRHDLRRACQHYSLPPLTPPPFFPMNSLLPQRTITTIKSLYPNSKFESIYDSFWPAVYTRHIDISKPENLLSLLVDENGLEENEAKKLIAMAGEKEWKERLNQKTKRAVDTGAFGCPWLIVRSDEAGKEGVEEVVFGSDRWTYVFKILGVEVQELRILDKGEEKARL